jgi:hypothetical protein
MTEKIHLSIQTSTGSLSRGVAAELSQKTNSDTLDGALRSQITSRPWVATTSPFVTYKKDRPRRRHCWQGSFNLCTYLGGLSAAYKSISVPEVCLSRNHLKQPPPRWGIVFGANRCAPPPIAAAVDWLDRRGWT